MNEGDTVAIFSKASFAFAGHFQFKIAVAAASAASAAATKGKTIGVNEGPAEAVSAFVIKGATASALAFVNKGAAAAVIAFCHILLRWTFSAQDSSSGSNISEIS